MDYGYGGGGGGNQYSTTSYGAQGGAGGGGFMPGSQSSPSGAKREFKNDSLRPVTIKQLSDASDMGSGTDFEVDGETFKQICLVGQVRHVSRLATNIAYRIDDGTGIMEVKSFAADDDATDSPLPEQDSYVKVFGHLKAFNNKRHVSALMIRPITDFNEISHHFLEATLVHLKLTRADTSNANAGAANGAAAQGGNEYGDKMDMDKNIVQKLNGMQPNARKVYNYLVSQPQGHEGINMHDIAQSLSMDVNACRRAGDELMVEGLTYSTMDEETWAPLIHEM